MVTEAARHAPAGDDALAWPREEATAGPPAGVLMAAGSNIVLDLHGDPGRARLVVYSDGNHHMALADAVARFAAETPEVGDVVYATTPPRILIEAMATGRLSLGNLVLSLKPHVFISPREILDRLHREGRIDEPQTFGASMGTAILVTSQNPRGVRSLADLLRPDVRLALSNPVTEAASFAVYEEAIVAECEGKVGSRGEISARLRSDAVIKSRVIHHREIPELLLAGRADASLVYAHLALRYVRAFPEHFAMLPATATPVTDYAIASLQGGGAFGRDFIAFMTGRDAGGIYEAHGLRSMARAGEVRPAT